MGHCCGGTKIEKSSQGKIISLPVLKYPKGSAMKTQNLKSPGKSSDGQDTNDNSTSVKFQRRESIREVVHKDNDFTIAQLNDEDRIRAAMNKEIFRLTEEANQANGEFEHNFSLDESFMRKDMI